MRPPGSPRCGVPGRLHIEEPRGSAPRERDHRGGDHPVPSRTRQLSPPSPRVLQRKAAGGQGVVLAEGAFLCAPREARGGIAPCGPPCILRAAASTTSACADMAARLRRPISAPGWLGRRRRMRDIRRSRCRGPTRRGVPAGSVLRSGAARLLGSALYALRVISPGASDGYICAMGGRRPAFFRYVPLPDSDFYWSLKALLRTIISKLYTVHWRNAGVGDCTSR